jgi:dCMP deaminase
MNFHKYMGIANATAQLSKDASTQVGAIVIGPTKEVRSLGYNGAPRGCSADEDERGVSRPEKYFWFSHAEANAISNAARVGIPLADSTIVVTHFPCMDCARLIVQAGIKHVVTNQPAPEFEERWLEHIARSIQLFKECGVTVELLPPTSDHSLMKGVTSCGNSVGGNTQTVLDFGDGELE